MYSIRQDELFSLEQLLDMSPRETYTLLFETLNITPFLRVVSKKSFYGKPTELNYAAMLVSLFIRIMERIPTIKDLIKRLARSVDFSMQCGFTGSDRIPSESSYSRMIRKLQGSAVFQETHNDLVRQAFQEGFVDAAVVVMDATHIEARDRQPEKQKQSVNEADELPSEFPKKKRARKTKAEREQWLQEQMELEANRPLFEKKVDEQLLK